MLSKVKPNLYALVKKNSRALKVVKVGWEFYLHAKIKVEGTLSGAKTLLPPTGTIDNLTAPIDNQWHQLTADIKFKKLSAEIIKKRKLPKTLDENIHWKFRAFQSEMQPETFLMTVSNGRVYDEGNIITPDDKLVSQVSKVITDGRYDADTLEHPVFKRKKLFPLKKISGTVAVLSAPAGRGYYHWMLDVLPRIHFLKEGGIAFKDIDCFLINNYMSKFHVETLALLGIPKNKIIESQPNPHLQADLLVVPSLVGETGSVPKFACDFLRQEFLKKIPADNRTAKRVYLNRVKVAHRRVKNEPEIIDLLSQYGFESIASESLSFIEQISLMAGAEVVIAPHGAGLTNIIFCKEKTKVIEFLYPSSVNVMYWTICNELNLNYYYLMAEGDLPPEGVNSYLNSDDMQISLEKLERTLKFAGLTRS